MKNNTYSVRSQARLDREEIARQHAAGLGAQELAPRGPVSARSRTKTRASDNRPDRVSAEPDAELAQLALDPHAAPPRILSRQSQHKLAKPRIDPWPTTQAAPIRPLPG